jgi:shikimate dehydrogenase
MHNAAFAATKLDAVYVPFPVAAEDFAATVEGLFAAGVAGLNVTVPHKEAAARIAVALQPRARDCGAVNTLVRSEHGFAGDNTDGAGLLAALAERRFAARGRHVLLIGAGGAARSVAHAFMRAGVASLTVANRTSGRAEELALSLHDRRAFATDLEALRDPEALESLDLIVNSTSTALGGGALPAIRFASTKPRLLCCDLMYGKPSRFLAQAKAAGRATMDGSGMLLHQGALAFTLWTRKRAPVAVMRRTLTQALSQRR